MKIYSIIFSIFLIGIAQCQKRIIDGTISNPFRYKFLVVLMTESGLNCGGALLDRSTILTAAHCTLPNIDQYALIHRFNLTKSDADETGIKIAVKSTINHPKFDATGHLENDVAIYKLAKPIPEDIAVSFIELNKNKTLEHDGNKVAIAGWGTFKLNSTDSSPVLRSSQLSIVNFKSCNTKLDGVLAEGKQLCMTPSDKKRESCEGDSGSPVFIELGKKKFVQVGITSYGEETCNAKLGVPSIYTSVNAYIDWIEKTWKQKKCKKN